MGLKEYNDSIIACTGDMDEGCRTYLEITGGDGNTDEHAEVHLLMRSKEGDFAQGWFRLDELREALDGLLNGAFQDGYGDEACYALGDTGE